MKINGNDLAKAITELEGGKESLSIAQVKEVLTKFAAYVTLNHSGGEILTYLERIGDKYVSEKYETMCQNI